MINREYKYDDESFWDAMAMAIVRHDSIFHCEHEDLRHCFELLNPDFKPISHNTGKADILKKYLKEMENHFGYLQTIPQRFSLGLWTF